MSYAFAGGLRAAQPTDASFAVSLNGSVYAPGDTMVVTAKLGSGTLATQVDAYVVVKLPTGQFLSLQLGGGVVPGIVPIARSLLPFNYEASLIAYTFSGVEPFGEYTWYAVLTRPGTLEFVGALQQTRFTLGPASTPETTRTELSQALRIGDFDAASELLGSALAPLIRQVSAADLAVVAGALESCAVVESTASYQVCVVSVSGDRFRFLLVSDENRKWRVLVW